MVRGGSHDTVILLGFQTLLWLLEGYSGLPNNPYIKAHTPGSPDLGTRLSANRTMHLLDLLIEGRFLSQTIGLRQEQTLKAAGGSVSLF